MISSIWDRALIVLGTGLISVWPGQKRTRYYAYIGKPCMYLSDTSTHTWQPTWRKSKKEIQLRHRSSARSCLGQTTNAIPMRCAEDMNQSHSCAVKKDWARCSRSQLGKVKVGVLSGKFFMRYKSHSTASMIKDKWHVSALRMARCGFDVMPVLRAGPDRGAGSNTTFQTLGSTSRSSTLTWMYGFSELDWLPRNRL